LTVIAPRRILLPFYTCNAVPDSPTAVGVPFAFYPIDERLEPARDLCPGPAELVLYINYFGLKGATARTLADRLGQALIVDDTQAFFERGYSGSWSFNSARKFFGVPDGAYLYAPVTLTPVQTRNEAPAWDHLISRLTGRQAEAYQLYLANEAAVTSEVRGMSRGAERLLGGIDYQWVAERRRENYFQYHAALEDLNRLPLPPATAAVPHCYPFLPPRAVDRERLHAQQLFVPTYWPDCMGRSNPGFGWERDLAARLLPLPVDHRYDRDDIARVISILRDTLGGMTC
jgi:hypothetical protein